MTPSMKKNAGLAFFFQPFPKTTEADALLDQHLLVLHGPPRPLLRIDTVNLAIARPFSRSTIRNGGANAGPDSCSSLTSSAKWRRRTFSSAVDSGASDVSAQHIATVIGGSSGGIAFRWHRRHLLD
jgi:hypothetical protein